MADMFASSAPFSASVTGAVAPEGLRAVIAAKERELHEINEFRLQTMEAALAEKASRARLPFNPPPPPQPCCQACAPCRCPGAQEREAGELKGRLAKIKEDYQYNLKVRPGGGRGGGAMVCRSLPLARARGHAPGTCLCCTLTPTLATVCGQHPPAVAHTPCHPLPPPPAPLPTAAVRGA
jgi:hypothetical protein